MDNPEIHRPIRADLASYYKNTPVGRHTVPVEVIKRIIVLRRYKK